MKGFFCFNLFTLPPKSSYEIRKFFIKFIKKIKGVIPLSSVVFLASGMFTLNTHRFVILQFLITFSFAKFS